MNTSPRHGRTSADTTAPAYIDAGGDCRRTGYRRSSPVRGEDQGSPHRRGVRVPRLPYPTAAQARNDEQAIRLHLAIAEGTSHREGQGADDHHTGHEQTTRRSARSAQPGTSGVGQLLPARLLEGTLLLPAPVHLAAGSGVA